MFEYREFRDKQNLFIGDQGIQLVFKDWHFGAASRSINIANVNNQTLSPSPMSLKLSNITEVSRITSFYLIKLLIAFELWDTDSITGISLIYDTCTEQND